MCLQLDTSFGQRSGVLLAPELLGSLQDMRKVLNDSLRNVRCGREYVARGGSDASTNVDDDRVLSKVRPRETTQIGLSKIIVRCA